MARSSVSQLPNSAWCTFWPATWARIRDQLIERVIGDGAIVIDRNIDVHVRSIRKKLGAYRDLVETIRGVGYRFNDGS